MDLIENSIKTEIKNVIRIQKQEINDEHVPSTTQADTLFNFTKELRWLLASLKARALFPRYNIEDISYLKIKGLPNIAYPMKCFCDINLHKLNEHLMWYGYYGIAFKKAWGMSHNIQPVHYINPKSPLAIDFAKAFTTSLQKEPTDSLGNQLRNHILLELMFFKPYSGLMLKPNASKRTRKCFSDESEWRFVPLITDPNLRQIYHQYSVLNESVLGFINSKMQGDLSVALGFDYEDIKYIIIKNRSDFIETMVLLKELEISSQCRDNLISKIIIWDEAMGDF